MIPIAEALDHLFETEPVSGLQIEFGITGNTLAKRLCLMLEIPAQCVLFGLHFIPG